MEFAFIKDGVVKQVLVYDKDPESPSLKDITNITPKPGPGWIYNGGDSYTEPAIQPPEENAVDKARKLLKTVDFATLKQTDMGKCVIAILIMLQAISNEV